jgi:tetratricopeptide (TPR) repeat protein
MSRGTQAPARRRVGLLLLALILVGAASACARGAAGEGGVIRPTETRHAALARAHLTRAEEAPPEEVRHHFREALAASLEGAAAQPGNPQHHFLAGVAHAGLGEVVEADASWRRALELWPEYGEQIARFREHAWLAAFERGLAAHRGGDVPRAMAEWEGANLVFPWRPEAYFNLGALRAEEGDFEGALAMYRSAIAVVAQPGARALTAGEQAERLGARRAAYEALGQLLMFLDRFGEAQSVYEALLAEDPSDVDVRSHLAVTLVRQGQATEASALFDALLATPGLGYRDLTQVGLGLFHGREYARAAEAFRRAAEMNQRSRDALHNLVLSLYAQTRWRDLIEPAERLLEVDPLNQSVALMLAHALRETGQTQRALGVIQRIDAQPVYLSQIQLRPAGGRATLSGRVETGRGRPGAQVRVRFILLDDSGVELDSQLLTVTVPPPGQASSFEIPLSRGLDPAGYRYQVAP